MGFVRSQFQFLSVLHDVSTSVLHTHTINGGISGNKFHDVTELCDIMDSKYIKISDRYPHAPGA